MSGEAKAARCGAVLHHAHGTSECDRPGGHDGNHGALCDICYENGYDDASDRLEWKHDGENWRNRPPA